MTLLQVYMMFVKVLMSHSYSHDYLFVVVFLFSSTWQIA